MNDRADGPAAIAPCAQWLGYAGVLPFVACVAGIVLLEGASRDFAARALLAYGAVILTFLGAVHWGFALRAPGARAVAWLVAGVLPSLVAWAALLLPAGRGLTLLAVGFGGFWLYEHRVVGTSLLPPGYLGLRRHLTLAVCALLALGIIALG